MNFEMRKKLIIRYMAATAVPTGGGIGSAVSFFSEPSKMKEAWQDGERFVDEAIRLVKTAPDNPYTDDDAILRHLIEECEKRDGLRI